MAGTMKKPRSEKGESMPDYGFLCGGDVVPASEMKRQFLDQGLKPTTGYVCIRRLADKQCRIGSFYGRPCECRHPLFDHTSLYIKGGKPHTLVTQPYGLDNRDLAALLAMCEKYGLEISITGYSWHFPGKTLCVEITRKH